MSAASGEPEVQRYDFDHPVCRGHCCCGGGGVEPFYNGDYVRYADYLTLAQQRDAAVEDAEARNRELHDEAVMLHTALLGRACAEPGSVSACHPMICDCGTPYEDYTHRDLCEAVARLRTRLAACERAIEGLLDDMLPVNAVAYTIGKTHVTALRAAVATDDDGPNDGHARTVNRSAWQEGKV